MQTSAFAAAVPLRRHALPRQTLNFSDRPCSPTCVAKPPPRKPRSKRLPKSNKRKRRSTTIADPAQREPERITAAQLSEKLSRAVRFDLILADISRLSTYFRSFVKPKPSTRPKQQPTNGSEPRSEALPGLAAPTQPDTYAPKSATATKIATTYTAARGAVDRALQVLSIHAKTYVTTFAQVAGDTVLKLLSAGHEALPALGLDRAKDAVADVLKDGWTPLSVFQWQLSAAPTEDLEQRRQARIRQISSFFRGGGVDNLLGVAGAALTGVGKAAEKLAPVMAKGVGKATSGYVERSRKPPSSAPAGNARIRKRRKEKLRRDGEYYRDVSARGSQLSKVAGPDVTPASVAMSQLQYPEVVPLVKPTEEPPTVPGVSPDKHEVYAERKSEHGADSDINPSNTSFADQGGDATEEVQKENAQIFRNGAIVLAAGAVATATVSFSVPTAITCSTLMVASMALGGAKAVNASDLQIRERHKARQSRSVRNLEDVLMKAPMMSTARPKVPKALLAPADEKARRYSIVAPTASNPLATSATAVDSASSGTIEAPAYAVSPSQPRIMSLPFVGFLLNWLDGMAYHVEGFVGTVLRRSGVRFTLDNSSAEWELLRSFRRNSRYSTRPD